MLEFVVKGLITDTNTDYDICIKVKDKDSTISKKYFTVKVTKQRKLDESMKK